MEPKRIPELLTMRADLAPRVTKNRARAMSRCTIHDVAQSAGVSTKTVSHVLNGRPGVNKDTRARVLKTAQDLGYHAHTGARVLRSKAIHAVGVAFPAPPDVVPLSRGFAFWLYEGLSRVFGSRGYYVTFDMGPSAYGAQADYARGVWEQAFGACVLAGPLALTDQTVGRIHRAGIPYLTFGRLDALPECSCATVDYEMGTYLSVKHLLAKGHRRVGMLKAFCGFQPGLERQRGYARALEEAGIALDERLVQPVNFDVDNITTMVHRILADHSVTALVDCSGTEDGAVLHEGARRAGRVPGGDFDVVAWTYRHDATVLPEACAHVWLPVWEAASEGLEQLLAWVEGKHEGPIQIVYGPVVFETAASQISKSLRLFETHA